jgi:fructokinase
VNLRLRTRIGVDLGGTKTEAVAIELREDTPAVLARRRIPTERERGYELIVERTRELIVEVAKEAGLDPLKTPIGVGMPGSTTTLLPDGTRASEPRVKNSNTLCLNGRPFHADLSRALGRRVAFSNDANCFALAEAAWGAARGARVTFGVILGTGVGGGIVMASEQGLPRAWDGAQGIAGEWGHVALEPARGPACYCGRRGCVETFLAGPSIEAAYAERTGVPRSLADIAVRARDGNDPEAKTLLVERVEIFGRALATVLNVLDPDVVVLGGGVSNLDEFYELGPKEVARWTFTDSLATRIVKHQLGDSAGVLGAALLP